MLWNFIKEYHAIVISTVFCSVMAAINIWAALSTSLDAWMVTAIIMIAANTAQWCLLFIIWQNPNP